MPAAQSGLLARSIPRREPWQDVEGWLYGRGTRRGRLGGGPFPPAEAWRGRHATTVEPLLRSRGQNQRHQSSLGLPSTLHPTPSRHSCPDPGFRQQMSRLAGHSYETARRHYALYDTSEESRSVVSLLEKYRE